MGKTFIIPKMQFFHPGKSIDFNRLLRYLETRPGVMQEALPGSDGSPWVDHGLGNSSKAIDQQCHQWESRRVLGRHLIMAPDPELLDHIPEVHRSGVIARTTEAIMNQWYTDNCWGQPEYAYVLHDKEKNNALDKSIPMMHAHIILPGTHLPDPDLRRQAHFISRPHILDLHRTAAHAFQLEFERVLGRDRAREIIYERNERLARERRNPRLSRDGGIPLRNRNRVFLDWSKLAGIKRALGLIRQQKNTRHKKQRQQEAHQRELLAFARQQRAERQAQEVVSQTVERARRIEEAKQRRLRREAEEQEALAQVRQRHLERLQKLRAKHIPYMDLDRGIE